MLLTNCAACAAPLAHDAPRCVRCKTRYCNSTCQHDHWRRGHKQICKKIHRGGNAEQYYADTKYNEAVAVAVEACAEDTKGQTCYICTEAVHWKTKEGLVRGCACRGTAGFAHVSCLAEQAKILVAEAEENNLSNKVRIERFGRWSRCSLCEHDYHGVVECALGWAGWKTYLGRETTDEQRCNAISLLGAGLRAAVPKGSAKRVVYCKEALGVFEAQLAELETFIQTQRIALSCQELERTRIGIMTNIASCYADLGLDEKSLSTKRDIYARAEACNFPLENLVQLATNLANSLIASSHLAEAKIFLRQIIRTGLDAFGPNHQGVLNLQGRLGHACLQSAASRDDLVEAEKVLADVYAKERRICGPNHPQTRHTQKVLVSAQVAVAKNTGK